MSSARMYELLSDAPVQESMDDKQTMRQKGVQPGAIILTAAGQIFEKGNNFFGEVWCPSGGFSGSCGGRDWEKCCHIISAMSCSPCILAGCLFINGVSITLGTVGSGVACLGWSVGGAFDAASYCCSEAESDAPKQQEMRP